jgi:hypothetical protein
VRDKVSIGFCIFLSVSIRDSVHACDQDFFKPGGAGGFGGKSGGVEPGQGLTEHVIRLGRD